MTWIIPCNTSFFDVERAFDRLKCIDWKQSRNINTGDIIYIYVGCPIKAILFKCRAVKVNMKKMEVDSSEYILNGKVDKQYGNYMQLELIKKYDRTMLTLEILNANGLQGSVQGPRRTNEQLGILFAKVEKYS